MRRIVDACEPAGGRKAPDPREVIHANSFRVSRGRACPFFLTSFQAGGNSAEYFRAGGMAEFSHFKNFAGVRTLVNESAEKILPFQTGFSGRGEFELPESLDRGAGADEIK